MNNYSKITCLTDNYPDGQKIYGVSIKYDRHIAADTSVKDAYTVKDRNITGVSVHGNEVILSLDIKDKAASIILQPNDMPNNEKHLPPESTHHDPTQKENKEERHPDHKPPELVPVPRVVYVTQTADIKAFDGTVIAADNIETASTEVCEPVINKFKQLTYNNTGYNLFIPDDYDENTAYPLVIFIHDAGVRGKDTKIALMQGNGAVSFAAPEWQAKHPCIVIAPQVAEDEDKEIPTIMGIIDQVKASYNVDEKRIYCTGQSMGCMTFCEMNIEYPDYFTASLLVAGQWDADRMAQACTGCKFWILVSNHDERAFPGMNDVVSALENKGVKFGRYIWDAKLPAAKLNQLAAKAREDDVDMRYTVFDGSSVVPYDRNDNPVTNHVCTWPVAYSIDELKEWLFSNVKD